MRSAFKVLGSAPPPAVETTRMIKEENPKPISLERSKNNV